jgi:hypothetical protein
MTSSTAYVTLRQYQLDKKQQNEEIYESRIKQDELLRVEFGKLHGKVDNLHGKFDDLHGKFDDLHGQFDDLHGKFDDLHGKFDLLSAGISAIPAIQSMMAELHASHLQLDSRMRNSLLRNPLSKLHAPVVYSPGKRLMRPELFPQTAQEFYRLRNPESDKQKEMIFYLADFYDITHLDNDTTDSEAEEESTIDSIAVVEALESILGLVERNFIDFREAAQRYAAEAPTTRQKRNPTNLNLSRPRAVKRTNFLPNQGEKSQAPVALPFRPSSPTNPEPPSSDMDGVGWYLKTPSDKAKRDARWKHAQRAMESASNDSSADHPVQEKPSDPVNASSGHALPGRPVQANASSGSATNPFPSRPVQGAVPDPLNASSGSTTNPNSASGRPSTESQSTGAHA